MAGGKVHYINRQVIWTSGGKNVIFACGRMQQICELKTTTVPAEATCLACLRKLREYGDVP
jgi:hypothetical protein